MTPCIWLGTTRPCNPPSYGLRVKLLFFMMFIYKPCLLSLLHVSAMKCCIKCPALCLITILAACFIPLRACLTCSSVHASSLHPLLAHRHLCCADVYCVFFPFLIHVTLLFDFILASCLCFFIWVWNTNPNPNITHCWYVYNIMSCCLPLSEWFIWHGTHSSEKFYKL